MLFSGGKITKRGCVMDYESEALPIAFTVALARNEQALKYFVMLPEDSPAPG